MNIGISLFSGQRPLDAAVVAQKAEALGFDSLWLGEHPVIPVHSTSPAPGSSGGSIPDFYSRLVDPFVALARASAVTTRLKLGTGIETELMGGNFAHRWAQTREAIEAMKALWANEAAEYHGTYYDFPLVRSFPRPVQQPHPPILLGGVAQQVFKRIVAYGNGWMPTRSTPEIIRQGRAVLNELALEAGRDPASITVLAYMAPAERTVLQALAEAGADAAVVRLEGESEAAALAQLEQLAQQVL